MALLEIVLFLLLCSVALGFLPELPQFPFDPQFILVLVLPPILYQAALLTSWRDFRSKRGQARILEGGCLTQVDLACCKEAIDDETTWIESSLD